MRYMVGDKSASGYVDEKLVSIKFVSTMSSEWGAYVAINKSCIRLDDVIGALDSSDGCDTCALTVMLNDSVMINLKAFWVGLWE